MKKLLFTLIVLVSSFTLFAAVGPVYDSTDSTDIPSTDKKAETVVSLDFSNAEKAEKSIIFGFSSSELSRGDFTPVKTPINSVSLALQDANVNGEVYAINEEDNSPVYVFYQIINGSDVNVKISLSGPLNYEESTDSGIGWTVKWGENSSVSEDSSAVNIITHSGSNVKNAGSYKLSISTDNLAKTTLQSKEYKANIVLEINDGN
ncbi:MAG TPA: hypothetical protein IAB12_00935 [Candidatus Ornithospirochaeta avicola]|uniref:Uncharacterized protein n=1 Tax=Candidatus Ornithospirochaeta avicola TaxID=2840896 RepID=A0A9D1PRM9_9SPIO|nr:hypothetical protein [Candidatus Ornithospirochaeta avicola]